MPGYKAIITKITDLAPATADAMCGLYLTYYDGCDSARFFSDLSRKTEVVIVYEEQTLIGFTTYELYSHLWRDRDIQIIYSGDTIIDRAHWGQQQLAFSLIRRAGELKRQQPNTALYWFLIAKGHRTFRYLPAFMHSFYPHLSQRNDELRKLSSQLAEEKFGENYDPATGIISFPTSPGYLKPAYAQPNERELTNDTVRYFLQRNPRYTEGDELACLGEMSEENLKPLPRRIFRNKRS